MKDGEKVASIQSGTVGTIYMQPRAVLYYITASKNITTTRTQVGFLIVTSFM